jgi:thymidylate kinase
VSVKLFVLGRPGSGKSTAYHHIAEYINQQYHSWSTIRFHDYEILQTMFQFEELFPNSCKHRQFHATQYGGFDVLDFPVLDTALRELEKQVRHRYDPLREELIVIEFARDDYTKALKQFSPAFLKDAYFLFIKADLKTCVQRVKDRVNNPPTIDNHFVSEDIFTKYYSKLDISLNFKKNLPVSIDRKRIKVINSRGTMQDFNAKVEEYIGAVLPHEDSLSPQQILKKVPDPKILTSMFMPTRH